MADPTVSILMPTRNAGQYLAEALESILGQTFSDYEFLVIDDASTDDTVEILQRYADERIRLLEGPGRGLAAALNYGIKTAKGRYIARMDADDVAAPTRLEKQVAYLDHNPEIGVCGTIFQEFMFGDAIHDHMENVRYADLLSGCYIGHPTAMFRRKLFLEHDLFYDESLKYSEDYELWGRAIRVTGLGNVPENLLKYRRHEESASRVHVGEMTKLDIDIKFAMIAHICGGLSEEKESCLKRMLAGEPLGNKPAEDLASTLLENLRRPELCSGLELFAFLQSCQAFSAEFTGSILEATLAETPFFVISFNQLTYLQKIVAFFEEYKIKNVQVIDNNSTYPPLLEYLRTIPFTVHRLDKNYGHMVLFEHEQFKEIIDNKYFVLTDPDIIPVEECPADFLRIFMELLLRHPGKNKVGFSLKIDDLPRHYELRENVLAWESRFYAKGFAYNGLTVYDAPLDTTFALYRPRKEWRTSDFYAAIRTGEPYAARHLAWYKNLRLLTEEDAHYRATDAGSSNWNGRLSSRELHKKYNTHKAWLESALKNLNFFRILRKTSGAAEQSTVLTLFGKLPLIGKTRTKSEICYRFLNRYIFYKKCEKIQTLLFCGLPLLSKKTRINSSVHTVLYLLDAIPLISKNTVANNIRYKLFNKFPLPSKRGERPM